MESVTTAATVIDADGLILGRMASNIAKRLLEGEHVMIVNSEKAVLSGRRRSRISEAKLFLEVGGVGRGPFHYRRPDRIVRKAVKGMLPIRQPKGLQAYKRLQVFIGVPDNLKDQKMDTLADAQAKRLTCPYFTVGELAKGIGWNRGE
jgi:large subunit ribosomal protein L13